MHRQSWKSLVISGILAGLVCSPAQHPAAAEDGDAAGAQAAPAKANPVEDMRAKLDGSRWQIEWAPIGSKGKLQKDALTFTKMTIVSERLSKTGYPETNYTLTIKENEPAVWETMQTKEGTGVVFWRGEVSGSAMQGVVSVHPKEGSPEDFSFSGAQASGIVAPEPAAEASSDESRAASGEATTGSGITAATPATPPAPAASSDESQQPVKKKRKKGWLGR